MYAISISAFSFVVWDRSNVQPHFAGVELLFKRRHLLLAELKVQGGCGQALQWTYWQVDGLPSEVQEPCIIRQTHRAKRLWRGQKQKPQADQTSTTDQSTNGKILMITTYTIFTPFLPFSLMPFIRHDMTRHQWTFWTSYVCNVTFHPEYDLTLPMTFTYLSFKVQHYAANPKSYCNVEVINRMHKLFMAKCNFLTSEWRWFYLASPKSWMHRMSIYLGYCFQYEVVNQVKCTMCEYW